MEEDGPSFRGDKMEVKTSTENGTTIPMGLVVSMENIGFVWIN